MPFVVQKSQLPSLLPWLEAGLPASFKVYQDLKSHIDGRWPGVQFVVDQWPEPKAVVETLDSTGNEKAECEAFLSFFVPGVYADEDQALAELLRNPDVIDWSTPKLFGAVGYQLFDTVKKVCCEFGQHADMKLPTYLLTAKPGDIVPQPVPDGLRLVPVDDALAETVDKTWKYCCPESGDYVRSSVKNFPSLALVTDTGHHVGHMIGSSFNCLSMLYVQPEYRHRGFAKVIVSNLAQKYFQCGLNAHVLIEIENTPSLELHTSIGFQVVPDFMFESTRYIPRNYEVPAEGSVQNSTNQNTMFLSDAFK